MNYKIILKGTIETIPLKENELEMAIQAKKNGSCVLLKNGFIDGQAIIAIVFDNEAYRAEVEAKRANYKLPENPSMIDIIRKDKLKLKEAVDN